MAVDITAMNAEIARGTTLVAGVKTLVERLGADAGVSQAQIDQMVAALDANHDPLEEVLLQNTPSDPNA